MIKPLLLAIGCVSVTLGVAGVILPLVPTTPFLLLAGVCFAKSSDRFHTWLMEHRILGPYIHNWRNRQMTSKDKVRTVAAIWVSMLSSAAITYINPRDNHSHHRVASHGLCSNSPYFADESRYG